MKTILVCALVLAVCGSAWAAPSSEHGEYIVTIAGCNDCHTDGYIQSDGQVAREKRLLGSAFGWSGPWGTTYATNLRRSVPAMSEDDWVAYARSLRVRPPMPWFNLIAMSEEDLRSVYRYIVSLGVDGEPAPQALPPGIAPQGPYALFK